MSALAVEIIALRDKLRAKQAAYLILCQDAADLIFPRENQITSAQSGYASKMEDVLDSTAILDSQDMASGLSAALIPSGQTFFGLKTKNKALSEQDIVRRYLAMATESAHTEMFESNFMLQLNETLRSLVVFGTGNLYVEWDARNGQLNYKDYDIAFYQIEEDNHGNVDTVVVTFPMTACQAVQEFGLENVGKKIADAYAKDETRYALFDFIHVVRPRLTRNPNLRDNRNMPYESVYVNVSDKAVVSEGGFEEFPFAVARWMKSSFEKYGRGQGTEILPDVKVLQTMKRDFIECGNKWNRPPLIVNPTFEGQVRLMPGAVNYGAADDIQGIRNTAMGTFPITREMLEFQQEIIHKAFFRDIFVQLADLRGDRRTTVEIMERIREGLRRLSLPVARLQSELFNPLITRSIKLLIRNGRIPMPPPQLQGESFGIEYVGELALALRSQQAKGFMQWATFVGQMESIFPGSRDNVNADAAIRRMSEAWGVNVNDVASEEEVAAKRQAAAQAMQMQAQAQMAQMAADGYKKTKDAPADGSAAKQVMDAMAQ